MNNNIVKSFVLFSSQTHSWVLKKICKAYEHSDLIQPYVGHKNLILLILKLKENKIFYDLYGNGKVKSCLLLFVCFRC